MRSCAAAADTRALVTAQIGWSLERMVPRDVFLAETEETGGTIVENVALLLF
jgi:hypothetical protein